jgi:hypothetical protein
LYTTIVHCKVQREGKPPGNVLSLDSKGVIYGNYYNKQ